MKKNSVLVGVCVGVVALGVIGIFIHNRGNINNDFKENISGDISSDNEVKVEKNEAIFALETYPRVDASESSRNIADRLGADFLGLNLDEILISYSNNPYKRLVDGEVDIVISEKESDDEALYASSKKVTIKSYSISGGKYIFIRESDTNNEYISKWVESALSERGTKIIESI